MVNMYSSRLCTDIHKRIECLHTHEPNPDMYSSEWKWREILNRWRSDVWNVYSSKLCKWIPYRGYPNMYRGYEKLYDTKWKWNTDSNRQQLVNMYSSKL